MGSQTTTRSIRIHSINFNHVEPTKVAVITAYFSKLPPSFLPPSPRFSVDHYLFSNFPIQIDGWKTVTLSGLDTNDAYGYRKLAKLPKVLPHLFLPEYQWFVWHDFNQIAQVNPIEIINYLDKHGKDFAGFQHSLRRCVYEEAETVRHSREHSDAIDKVKKLLMINGIGSPSGLYELTAFYRRNCPKLNEAFAYWMDLINNVSSRDQLTFPLIIKKFQIDAIQTLAGTAQKHVGGGNEFFLQYNSPLIVSSKGWR
jgi:hypothetical protein